MSLDVSSRYGRAWYNDNDPFAAEWLRHLVSAGEIAPGDVDERSIFDIQPEDLEGYTQCHFFAGIGGWSRALRLAGYPDDKPVWTGSCPCQPFSQAGKQKGRNDERHLWPEFLRLISECRPASVFGEQVASNLGRDWLSGVRTDLEDLGYAVGAADLCAAGIGVEIRETQYGEWLDWTVRNCPDPTLANQLRDFADWSGREIILGPPHIRQRLFWVADADGGNAGAEREQRGRQHGQQPQDGGSGGGMGNASRARLSERGSNGNLRPKALETYAGQAAIGASAWSRSVFIPCSDDKARRFEPGIFPLAHGVSNRVGTLRGSGNAIVPEVAATFIKAWEEVTANA